MDIDVLVAEIGSTTTIVNAFDIENCKFIGQGEAPTTVLEGNVNIGLTNALINLKENLSGTVINNQNICDKKTDDFSNNDKNRFVENEDMVINYKDFFATSSAAGGLKMTVHGLVYDMTVKAAKEAALGAGAIMKFVTAGKLRKSDIKKIQEIKPNIILIAGGVDYGERETSLFNAQKIANLNLNVPVIYAGNIENRDEVIDIFGEMGQRVYITENVYPRIDLLNVEPARRIIQEVFEEHIVEAKGMEKVRTLVNERIIPTPGAVMKCAELLYEEIGDLMVVDVGGATTDIHSVTEGSEEVQKISISPEPTAKRTVEGDLGVYVNMEHILEKLDIQKLRKEFPDLEELIKNKKPIPTTKEEILLVDFLAKEATSIALNRHSGEYKQIYGAYGKKIIAEGKDLTKVKWIIGTGGALTKLDQGHKILVDALNSNKNNMALLPKEGAEILIDKDYIMASVGALSTKYKEAAIKIMERSLNINKPKNN